MYAELDKYLQALSNSKEFVLYLHRRLIHEEINSLFLALSLNYIYTNHQIINLGKLDHLITIQNENVKKMQEEAQKMNKNQLKHLINIVKKGKF